MNDTEQRIAIAKATGCTMAKSIDGFWVFSEWVFSEPGHPEKFAAKHHTELEAWRLCAKKYTTDLNAMHEAEKSLTDDQLKSYDGWLIAIAGTRARRATAKERSEAFCLTLGITKP